MTRLATRTANNIGDVCILLPYLDMKTSVCTPAGTPPLVAALRRHPLWHPGSNCWTRALCLCLWDCVFPGALGSVVVDLQIDGSRGKLGGTAKNRPGLAFCAKHTRLCRSKT